MSLRGLRACAATVMGIGLGLIAMNHIAFAQVIANRCIQDSG